MGFRIKRVKSAYTFKMNRIKSKMNNVFEASRNHYQIVNVKAWGMKEKVPILSHKSNIQKIDKYL